MKGILKTFEVIIGLSIILITFVVLYTTQQPLPEFETLSWRTVGLNSLHSLDVSNELRYDALNNNTAIIGSKIAKFLPPNVDFLVQVCDLNCDAPTIEATKSTSVHYLISGDANNSTAREIIIYMWSNE